MPQGTAILSESVRNRDTGEPGISISIDFGKFPVSVSESESTFTKIWYPTQWFWAFHQNLCYKTCLTLVSVSESKFSLFLVSVSVSESTRCRTSLSIGIGIEKAGIAGSCCKKICRIDDFFAKAVCRKQVIHLGEKRSTWARILCNPARHSKRK